MKKENAKNSLVQYNRWMNRADTLYHDYAVKIGLSDCALWIFYALREAQLNGKGAVLQNDLVLELCLPRQTINSALKKLEKDGLVCLSLTGVRHSTQVELSVQGETFAKQHIDRLLDMEEDAAGEITEEEARAALEVIKKYVSALEKQFQHQ